MSPQPITENTLFYGDNLPILRDYIADESVDLIYLDPPFNSNRNYNVLFKDESGQQSEAQITAFEDTWHWNQKAEESYRELVMQSPDHISKMISALHDFIGANQMMAYLMMMAIRLVELHRVLKPTGSLYLHCDPTASHYLKIILDTVFGAQNFRNEIIWQRTNAKSNAFTRFATNHDVILRYTKTEKATWNAQYTTHSAAYIAEFYHFIEPETGRHYTLGDLTNPNRNRPNLTYEFLGITRVWRWTKDRMQEAYDKGLVVQSQPGTVPRLKRYLDEQEGMPVSDVWADIRPVQSQSKELLGYPTQKPLALLERIITVSSNAGDIVLDPFCGCGTAIAAAQKLGRKWIGIDITHLSIALQKYRLQEMFPEIQFKVVGEPEDIGAARQLARDDRYQFQWWALSLIKAKPLGGQEGSRTGKKGSDKGIDGVITFIDDETGKAKRALVQVKSGHVTASQVRDLVGTVQRENAALGIFITLEPPSQPMITEAVSAGFYQLPGWGFSKEFPRIQILTIDDLLHQRADAKIPSQTRTFKRAGRVKESSATLQTALELAGEE
ncbi:MAG TPA: DNA methyltransferase [Ktedonobacteraceae bacterium]|nr:DNA methyltransferase [Ktedonobacteraceae bacterium]